MNKNLIIIVGKDGRPSMKGVYNKMLSESYLWVRRRLIRKSGAIREYWRTYWNHNVDTFDKVNNVNPANNIVIRWGNTIPLDLNGAIVYNKAENIAKATNKKLCREIFEENNLNCPKLIRFEAEATSFPIIARPFKHSKGKNFIVLKNLEQFKQHYYQYHLDWYYSAYVDKVQEFRLHIGHSKILNYLEKPKPNNPNQLAWNIAQNGQAFDNVKWSDYNGKVCDLAIKALKILGLDFGAVDIMIDKDGKPYLLEVNTAGTLSSSEYSMSRYAMYFDWLAKKDTRREHHENKEYKKASNYAWHTYHFEDREPNNND